jgi:hypothetical protein
MRARAAVAGIFAVGACVLATPASADPAPNAAPIGNVLPGVPDRTSISFRADALGVEWGTPNETESRTGLSMVKLYIVDYALRHGDGSDQDRQLGERMIRYSDDSAASALAVRYPNAIDAAAGEYRLPATHSGDSWSSSYTSVADITKFLDTKVRTDPNSPILAWMREAAPVAADGTQQNWGTSRLPGVNGSKWGWSDYGPQDVASASIGPGFTVAAHTHGSPDDQTADVLGALTGTILGVHPPFPVPSTGSARR